ncbi:hypothetical protein AB0M47_11780 [Hamadaea sp. NPDC051192]|uniref:hypothetical protein n=1 Tax=Hamadaea sp. NPDC051192 TaxID=3154940 RepID=UPI00344319FF
MEHLAAVRAVLQRLIEDQMFDGREELLAQVPFVRVVGGPVTHLALEVDPATVPPSTFLGGRVPGCAWVRDSDGEPVGTLLVWIDRGYIAALEYGWVTDQLPTELPNVEQIYS